VKCPHCQKEFELSMDEIEKSVILKILEYFDNNKTKAAEAFQITPRTIRNKLHGTDETPIDWSALSLIR